MLIVLPDETGIASIREIAGRLTHLPPISVHTLNGEMYHRATSLGSGNKNSSNKERPKSIALRP
jgi:hypothetical protein